MRGRPRHERRRHSMVEVGSLAGFSTRVFASHFQAVHSVDPYEPGYDAQDMNSKLERLALAVCGVWGRAVHCGPGGSVVDVRGQDSPTALVDVPLRCKRGPLVLDREWALSVRERDCHATPIPVPVSLGLRGPLGHVTATRDGVSGDETRRRSLRTIRLQ